MVCYFLFVAFNRFDMAKKKRETPPKKAGVMSLKKRPMKGCSIKLKRLSIDTINRLMKPKHITHNLNLELHRDKLTIDAIEIPSKNRSFDVELKVSSKGIVVVEQPKHSELSLTVNLGRSLRPRANVPQLLGCSLVSKPKSKPVSTVAKSNQMPIQKLIDSAWQTCKIEQKQNKFEIGVNNIVLAKVKGFQAWPATVLENRNKKSVKVQFFGANDNAKFGFVSENEITLFNYSANVVKLILKKRLQKYDKAVKEAEISCGIPQYASLLND